MKNTLRLCSLVLLIGAICLLSGCALAESSAKWPEQSGQVVKNDGKMKMDASHTAEGYFMAGVQQKTSKKIKLRVAKDGVTLTYDLNGDGDLEVIPLQLGSGKYEVSLWENVSAKKYSSAGKITLNVTLSREDIAFFYPNQYVNYTVRSQAVSKAGELCQGKSEKDAYAAVRDFMQSSFAYDYVKSLTVKAGTLPDIDGSYEKKMGVCQDLSAIMCCMLRTQGIPCRLIIGYADKNYHAWTVAQVGGQEMFFDPTAALSAISPPKAYSVERFY